VWNISGKNISRTNVWKVESRKRPNPSTWRRLFSCGDSKVTMCAFGFFVLSYRMMFAVKFSIIWKPLYAYLTKAPRFGRD